MADVENVNIGMRLLLSESCTDSVQLQGADEPLVYGQQVVRECLRTVERKFSC